MTFFGIAKYGFSYYGRSIVFYDPRNCLFSLTACKKTASSPIGFRGIYQRYNSKNGKKTRLIKLYKPTNPRTPLQQANRQKIANAVFAWQCLTDSEKDVYNNRKYPRFMSGYNRFIKEYLKSH